MDGDLIAIRKLQIVFDALFCDMESIFSHLCMIDLKESGQVELFEGFNDLMFCHHILHGIDIRVLNASFDISKGFSDLSEGFFTDVMDRWCDHAFIGEKIGNGDADLFDVMMGAYLGAMIVL